MVGGFVAPTIVGWLDSVGAAVAGRLVGSKVGWEDGSTATVGKDGALVAPGSVGWEETTEEGCRVGLTRIGDVGAVVGLTGALVGVALGCAVGVTTGSVGELVTATGEGLGLREG